MPLRRRNRAVADPDSPAGEAIAGYRDLHRIGRGGFSVVYRAHQDQLDREVALKVLSVEFIDAAVRRRFLREVTLTSRLTGHPNVVTVLDSGLTSAGRPYIAMEYFERGSLRDRLAAEGPLAVAEVLRIGVKMAGALGAAHAEGMLHRDVKPQNILVSRFGEPALADFGTARLTAALEVSGRNEALTPHHAAPELLQGRTPTPACDVYSLGSTLHQLLSGRAPYQDADGGIAALLLRVLSADPPPIERADVPAGLVDVLRRAMAKDPAQRFADAWTFAAALQRVQDGMGAPVTELASGPSLPTGGWPATAGTAPGSPAANDPPAQPSTQDAEVSPPTRAAVAPAPEDPAAWLPMRPVEPVAVDWPARDTAAVVRDCAPLSAPTATDRVPPGVGAAASTDPVNTATISTDPVGIGTVAGDMAGTEVGAAAADGDVLPRGGTRRGLRWPAVIAVALLALAGLAAPLVLGGSRADTTSAGPPAASRAATGPGSTAGAGSAVGPPGSTPAAASAPPAPGPDIGAARPTALTTVDEGATVVVEWTLAPGTETYPLALQQAPVDPGQAQLITLDAGTTSHVVTGLDPAKGYCFLVGPVLRLGSGSQPATVAFAAQPACVRGAHASGA